MKPETSDAERFFMAHAQRVFHAYPELLSFCLAREDASEAVAEPEEIDSEAERFELHVALATDVSDDFQKEMCEAVTEFLTDMLQDRPETLDLLRGRTFARTIH